jgi:hypothetical protein
MIIPLKYVRLFVDAAGLSHFEERTLPLATRNFAPPTTPLEVSEFIPAAGFAVVRFAADWSGPWHPSPYRQWFFMLSGSLTITACDAAERTSRLAFAVMSFHERSRSYTSLMQTKVRSGFVGRLPATLE